MRHIIHCVVFSAFVAAPLAAAFAAPVDGLVILAGEFGTLGAKRKLDIVARLQHYCGTGADSCNVFCSETSFGLYRVGRKAICRVIYRCPDASTRSVEAAREEPILISCRREADEEPSAGFDIVKAENLQPPPYLQPSSGR